MFVIFALLAYFVFNAPGWAFFWLLLALLCR